MSIHKLPECCRVAYVDICPACNKPCASVDVEDGWVEDGDFAPIPARTALQQLTRTGTYERVEYPPRWKDANDELDWAQEHDPDYNHYPDTEI